MAQKTRMSDSQLMALLRNNPRRMSYLNDTYIKELKLSDVEVMDQLESKLQNQEISASLVCDILVLTIILSARQRSKYT